MKSASRAIFPGSFDPLTNGHAEIVRRTLQIFDQLIIGVLENPVKATLFTVEERQRMIEKEFSQYQKSGRIKVVSFSGLLVDFAKRERIKIIIRGLRAISDYEYETQMALMNKHLSSDLETFFLMTEEKYSYISSSLVKQIAKFGGDVSALVPNNVLKGLKEKYKNYGSDK